MAAKWRSKYADIEQAVCTVHALIWRQMLIESFKIIEFDPQKNDSENISGERNETKYDTESQH